MKKQKEYIVRILNIKEIGNISGASAKCEWTNQGLVFTLTSYEPFVLMGCWGGTFTVASLLGPQPATTYANLGYNALKLTLGCVAGGMIASGLYSFGENYIFGLFTGSAS